MRSYFLLIPFFLFQTAVFAGTPFLSCAQDQEKQKLRSAEIQKLRDEDIADRTPIEQINWDIVLLRDELRRKRIGEIFGEGCFKTASDYASAALIYQHGLVPDHYFQAFLWAKKAVELDDNNAKWLVAAGIDRYLVKSGYKQLFGTQITKPEDSSCWCFNQVEDSFPAKKRFEYTGKTLEESIQLVDVFNSNNPMCSIAKVCTNEVKETPVGSVPGFW